MLPSTPRLLFALAVAGTALTAAVPSAEAAYPGKAGKIVYVEKHIEAPISRLILANADGSGQTPITDFSSQVNHPVWSPDGTKIAYQWREHAEADSDIRVYDTATGADEVVAGFDGDQYSPTWSPDSVHVAYEDAGDVDKVRADGTSTVAETVFADEGDVYEPAWSSTNMLAFVVNETEHRDIYAVPVGGGDLIEVTDDTADKTRPDWSPDGQRIVYETNGTLAIRDLANNTIKSYAPTDTALDSNPVFAPDGARILWSSDREMADMIGTRLWSGTSDPAAPAATPLDPGDATYVDEPDWQPIPGPKREEPKREEPRVDPPVQHGQPAPVQVPQVSLPRAAKAASRTCASKRVFKIRLKRSRGDVIAKAKVVVNGKKVRVKKLDRVYATVDLRKLPRGSFDVHITTTMKGGKVKKDVRRYQTCAPKKVSKTRA